jgi:hypothetical protein
MAAGTIAYFSMDIAIENEIPTYSGGLGVLAGDTLRAAADLAPPVMDVTRLPPGTVRAAPRRRRHAARGAGHLVDPRPPGSPLTPSVRWTWRATASWCARGAISSAESEARAFPCTFSTRTFPGTIVTTGA